MYIIYLLLGVAALIGLGFLLDWISTIRCPSCNSAHVKWDRYNMSGSPNRQKQNHFRCLACGHVLSTYNRPGRYSEDEKMIVAKDISDGYQNAEGIIDTSSKAQVGPTTIEWRHRAIQKNLYSKLIETLGVEYKVQIEVNGVDILVELYNKCYIIEIKSDSEIKDVVRSSIGQLLEYSTRLKMENSNRIITIISYGGNGMNDYDKLIIKGYQDVIKVPYWHFCVNEDSDLIRTIKKLKS
jgi:transposase-like protein